MNHTRMAKILFLSVAGITFSVIAMEKEIVRQRFAPKKISANQQQEGKGKRVQKKLSKKEVEKKKQEEEESQLLEKKRQELAEIDKTELSVEKVNTPRYLIVDEEDDTAFLLNDITPSKRASQKSAGTPMIVKHISHTNPMKLIIELDKAVENKDQVMVQKILSDPIFVDQIKAFTPYAGAINEDTERFNKNIRHVQDWIAQKEQSRIKKSQPRKTNTNG
jgi:hypothetical protein